MTDISLRAVFQRRPYTNAVADGAIKVPGVKIDFVEVDLISKAMSAVCDLEYDIGEITLTDYMMCRNAGKPIVGLPVFVTRNFLHNRIWYHTRSGISSPKDLEGKRVGLKSYPQTAPFWNRGILATEYGVDVGKVTWVSLEGAHLREYDPPANVQSAPVGATLAEMLETGEIDAADDPGRPWTDRDEVWSHDPDVIKPLVPVGKEEIADWYRRTQVYPILHMIVVKREAIDRRPTLVADLFGAFVQARNAWMANITNPDAFRQRGRDIVGSDFLPYGVGPNKATLELACKLAYDQAVTSRALDVEDLFDRDIIELRA
ncbi:ABC transporter substrate-binding protein [Aminobacter sp. AP02]|uniref:ABC transporter substrate-binding protein n=1 Tax=Aminobacter sp. AP02 TaxID=2135737 RepID=UPI000D6D99D8|nr:ABC transporter substrate-binding protein [Aminobacter sp. AP02]PWK60333.1 4,5-dihydroxyphthalate decarboxylase [Aminobacter sp. AP02]